MKIFQQCRQLSIRERYRKREQNVNSMQEADLTFTFQNAKLAGKFKGIWTTNENI